MPRLRHGLSHACPSRCVRSGGLFRLCIFQYLTLHQPNSSLFMKNIEKKRQTGREPYEVPAAEVLEIRAEAGFAASGSEHADFEEENYEW